MTGPIWILLAPALALSHVRSVAPPKQEQDSLEDFVRHLEFFGYKCERDDDAVDAFHESDPYFRFFKSNSGIVFVSPFEVNSAVKNDVPGFLEFLNDVNAKACRVSKFYFEDEIMWVEAWYPDLYDKTQFGSFFRRVLEEIGLPRAVLPEGVKKYLAPSA